MRLLVNGFFTFNSGAVGGCFVRSTGGTIGGQWDLLFAENSVVIVLKWSKTLQDRKQVATVTIPALGSSFLCPHKALTTLLQYIP